MACRDSAVCLWREARPSSRAAGSICLALRGPWGERTCVCIEAQGGSFLLETPSWKVREMWVGDSARSAWAGLTVVHVLAGGSDGSRLYDCVWRYNSSVNEWTEVAPMLKAREYHSSSVLDGLLYVVAADSTERYDHTTDSWEALQPMTYPMDNCSTTACRGRLYAIGSLAGKETMVMQCYHPDAGLWSLVDCGQLPPWSFAPKTVTLNGLMYFIR